MHAPTHALPLPLPRLHPTCATVRPDGRLSILTVVTDFLSVAAQAADTFSIHFADAAVQADQVQYQDGPQWLALRRLTTNLRSVSDSLSRLEDKLK